MTVTTAVEPRVHPQIRAVQERCFGTLLRQALASPFYRAKYESLGFGPERPLGLSDRARLPFTTRAELLQDQRRQPPWGSDLALAPAQYTRAHRTTSAPALWWLDTSESWSSVLDGWAEAYRAAEVGAEDRVLVTLSLGTSIEGWAALEAAQRVGALALAEPRTSAKARRAALRQLGATVLVAAAADGVTVPTLRTILLAAESAAATGEPAVGEPTVPARAVLGSAEIGTWGHACAAAGRVHVHETGFVVEVVDPASREPAPFDEDGRQRGELVLTNLGRTASPLIRYLSGQRVALSREPCPCGRNTAWIVGEASGAR